MIKSFPIKRLFCHFQLGLRPKSIRLLNGYQLISKRIFNHSQFNQNTYFLLTRIDQLNVETLLKSMQNDPNFVRGFIPYMIVNDQIDLCCQLMQHSPSVITTIFQHLNQEHLNKEFVGYLDQDQNLKNE